MNRRNDPIPHPVNSQGLWYIPVTPVLGGAGRDRQVDPGVHWLTQIANLCCFVLFFVFSKSKQSNKRKKRKRQGTSILWESLRE